MQFSVKVIFGQFQNMEELQREVLGAAYGAYQSYLQKEIANGKNPVYKNAGLGYIRFAQEEKTIIFSEYS